VCRYLLRRAKEKAVFMVKRDDAGGVLGVFRVYTDVNDLAILAPQ
jgi:hypothetical protein